MQIALSSPPTFQTDTASAQSMKVAHGANAIPLTHYQIIRRNGAVVPFEPAKIAVAMMKAFLAVHGTQGAASASVREVVDGLTWWSSARSCVRARVAALSISRMCRTMSSWG